MPRLIHKRKNDRSFSKKIIVFYHKDCLDGFGAAWSAWKKFGNRAEYAAVSPYAIPEDLKGKQIPVLANLEPRKIMGQQSNGMILAVDVSGEPILLHPAEKVANGSQIR